MKQKITITVAAMATLLNGLVAPQVAKAEDTNNFVYDSERLFFSTRVDPKVDNIDGNFNHSMMPDVRLHSGTYITYDETKFSQRYVEEHLAEYVTNPNVDWLKDTLIFRSWADFGAQIISTTSVETWEDREFIKSYRPGVVYYIMETTWQDNPSETKWYWGKIDYRRCAAAETEDGFDLSGICVGWMSDEGEYQMTRIGAAKDPGDKYVSWADELQSELEVQLNELEESVEDWDGDKFERKNLLEQLGWARMRAEDTEQIMSLQARVDTLIAQLGEDEVEDGGDSTGGDEDIDQDKPGADKEPELPENKPTVPEVPVEPTVPDSESTTKPVISGGSSGNSGGNWSMTPGNNINMVGSAPSNDLSLGNAGTGSVSDVNVDNSDGIIANAGKEMNKNDQWSVLDSNGLLQDGNEEGDRIDVPDLSESSLAIPYKKWLLIPGIGVILMALVALGIWLWRKYSHSRI